MDLSSSYYSLRELRRDAIAANNSFLEQDLEKLSVADLLRDPEICAYLEEVPVSRIVKISNGSGLGKRVAEIVSAQAIRIQEGKGFPIRPGEKAYDHFRFCTTCRFLLPRDEPYCFVCGRKARSRPRDRVADVRY